jgi:hypothetical protein
MNMNELIIFVGQRLNKNEKSHETPDKEGGRETTDDADGLPVACEGGAGRDGGGRHPAVDQRGMDAAHTAPVSHAAADREGTSEEVHVRPTAGRERMGGLTRRIISSA